jgi:Sortase domain
VVARIRFVYAGVAAGTLLGLGSVIMALGASPDPPKLTYHAVAPAVMRAEDPTPTPVPAPTPAPYSGPVASLYLASAGIDASAPVEQRGTRFEGGREVFADPSAPGNIAWYSDARFGHPGFRGQNSVFAAHVNYMNYGNGPFAHLASAEPGGSLYVTMGDGTSYAYTIISVTLVPVETLNSGGMDTIVYPPLDDHTERVTLISCGGDFVAYPRGGGEYTSRVVVVAERYAP